MVLSNCKALLQSPRHFPFIIVLYLCFLTTPTRRRLFLTSLTLFATDRRFDGPLQRRLLCVRCKSGKLLYFVWYW